jgi:hypothetical protein
MNQLHMTPFPISRFTHNADKRMLYADISDLSVAGALPFSQIYSDACDEGLAVYNPRTGSTTVWNLASEVRNSDAELFTWVLVPTPETCKRHPAVSKYVMHLLND